MIRHGYDDLLSLLISYFLSNEIIVCCFKEEKKVQFNTVFFEKSLRKYARIDDFHACSVFFLLFLFVFIFCTLWPMVLHTVAFSWSQLCLLYNCRYIILNLGFWTCLWLHPWFSLHQILCGCCLCWHQWVLVTQCIHMLMFISPNICLFFYLYSE